DGIRFARSEFIEGSRFVYPLSIQQMRIVNQIGNMFFAKWFSWFLGRPVTDVLSGIKAISKPAFERINKSWGFLGINDPFGDFELLYGAKRHSLKMGEIPMRYYPRTYGETKTKVWRHGMILGTFILSGFWIFRTLTLRKRAGA